MHNSSRLSGAAVALVRFMNAKLVGTLRRLAVELECYGYKALVSIELGS